MKLLLALASLSLTSFVPAPLSAPAEGVYESAGKNRRDGGKKKDKEEEEEDCKVATVIAVCPIG